MPKYSIKAGKALSGFGSHLRKHQITESFIFFKTKHMKNTKHGEIEVYLACECPRERMRWHAIWLLADTENPRKPREVAAIVGCTTDCVRKLRRRYNADGEEVQDKRKTNGGRPFLDAPQQASLEKAFGTAC